jgi:hypothetical protein
MWLSALTVGHEVTIVTVKEYGGPVLIDSRFVFGRGGMITVAVKSFNPLATSFLTPDFI